MHRDSERRAATDDALRIIAISRQELTLRAVCIRLVSGFQR